MTTIVVTGGRGFIGSHFVELLLDKGYKVIDVDKCTYAANEKLPFDDNPNYKHFKEDISRIYWVQFQDEEGIPFLVNFAAESHVDRSINSDNEFIRSNVLGVQNLLNQIREYSPSTKFIQISTDEVYGDSHGRGEFHTRLSLRPSNPYSASKAAAEMLVMAYGRTYGINYSIFRMANNFGTRQHPEKFIPKVINSIIENKPITFHGDGNIYRDWLYVKDAVKAIYDKMFIVTTGVDNIGSKFNYSIVKIADIISNLMDKPYDYIFVPERWGQDIVYKMRSNYFVNRDKSELDFEDDLIEVIEWVKSQR